jgi:hypothetical protein
VLLGDGTTQIIDVTVIQLQNVDVFVTDHSNGGTLDNLNVQNIKLVSISEAGYAGFYADSSVDNSAVVCFTPGALIETRDGHLDVEKLRPGDFVRTLDRGYQKVRWVGCRTLGPRDLSNHPNLCPVVIRKGALGNLRRMLVSPQHGFLIDDHLVRAKHLAQVWGGKVARVDHRSQGVNYVHFLCDRHEIVFVDGAATESLYPGPMAMKAMDRDARAELMMIFPDLCAGFESRSIIENVYGEPVRSYRKASDLRLLKAREPKAVYPILPSKSHQMTACGFEVGSPRQVSQAKR